MDETIIHFYELAKRALEEYDYSDYSLMFIRHSDNVTFKVEGSNLDSYLLRIHIPITDAMGAHGTDSNMVLSELLWLEALSRDTNLVLQKPIRNRAGDFITQVKTKSATQPINCTLMRWLDGQPYHRDLESEVTARHIGELIATLHNHAAQWEIPGKFKRPRRNAEYFERSLRTIHVAMKDGRISASDYAELEASITLLIEILRSMDVKPQTDGIMHADAHKGNMLYSDGTIRLIDFSFCAFGNFMFDLSVCLSDMKESIHWAFLENYRDLRVLPDDHEKLIEGFFVGTMVGTFSYWVANPNAQKILTTKVPLIVRDYATKFNHGEYFWFS